MTIILERVNLYRMETCMSMVMRDHIPPIMQIRLRSDQLFWLIGLPHAFLPVQILPIRTQLPLTKATANLTTISQVLDRIQAL